MTEKKPNRLYAQVEALHDGELSDRKARRARELVRGNEAAAEHFRDAARIGELLRAHNAELARDADLSGLWTRVRHGIRTPQIDREPTWFERLFARPVWAAPLALAASALFLLPLNVVDTALHRAPEPSFAIEPVAGLRTIDASDAEPPMILNDDGAGMPVVLYSSAQGPGAPSAGAPAHVRYVGLVE